MYYFSYCYILFIINFHGFQPPQISNQISHNVPAVYDVFAVAIKEHEVFQQPQKCAGVKHHKGR